MIDLHVHTTESDGTFTPVAVIDAAQSLGVKVLAITDHDTFLGYDQASRHARAIRLHLVCGIELSTKLQGQSTHLLGYFPCPGATQSFRRWVLDLQRSRHERNIRLAEQLQKLGVPIKLSDLKANGVTGRPHFARRLVEIGFASNIQHAFDEYLAESGKAYVARDEPTLAEGLCRIRDAQGISSLAHPVRIKDDLALVLPELRDLGLDAIEAYHSDHSSEDTLWFLKLAADLRMLVTGGSDFHGANKPDVQLATGRNGNLWVPDIVLRWLTESERHLS